MSEPEQPKKCAYPEQLVGDARRQATALFKGVDFQIWLTVGAWINLNNEQLLVVEGVEDFDIVDHNGGVATQVKALAKPISLRSSAITETIRNFWQARHCNPGQEVRYNFITTAAFAVESGEPFGGGNSGLSLWTSEAKSANPTETSEKLRRFLFEDDAVSKRLGEKFQPELPSLVEFLRNCDSATFHREIIRPLVWEHEHGGVETAKGAVAETLHAYGEKMGLFNSDSDRALSHLFCFIAHKAYKEHRKLTREDFRTEFERAVGPGMREIAGQNMAMTLATQLLRQGGELSLLSDKAPVLDIPRIPSLCVPREQLVQQIQYSLSHHCVAALHGSTGKGKSTLAKLTTSSATNPWAWLSFARKDSQTISRMLDEAARFVASSDSGCLVLDNLDVPVAEEARLARKLATLCMVASFQGGRVIITTQRALPHLFFRETGIPEGANINIPNLEKDEIQDLCVQAGCPGGRQLQAHAAIIYCQTLGHPQLVNAAVSTRRGKGWPTPDIHQILVPAAEILEERKLARQLLDDLSTDEVELLNRLSLVSMAFRRDQAIIIGEIAQSVTHPGNCFDKLVGPWIEPTSDDRYRLSSLLSNAAEQNYSKDQVAKLRGSIGRAILSSGTLTQREAGEILFQAVVIKDPTLALPVLKSLYISTLSKRALWANALSWLLALADTKAFFPTDPMVTCLLHQVQFRLAVASNHESTSQFAEALLDEVLQLKSAKAPELIRKAVSCDILLAVKTSIPPKLLLWCWLEIISGDRSEIFSEFIETIEKKGPHRFSLCGRNFSDLFFGFILYRRGGCDLIRQFIQAVDELPGSDRQLVLGALKTNESGLRHFIDQTWIQEGAAQKPDWEKVIGVLQEAWEAGRRWGFCELLALSARGISLIHDEYLNHQDAAFGILDQAAKEIGTDVIMLRYQRGNIFYRQNHYAEAYQQWSSVKGEMKTADFEDGVDVLFAYPKFAEVAGRLKQWDEASGIFFEGRDIAKRIEDPMRATAFGVDAAHALWFGSRRVEAISLFATCFEELEAQSAKKQPEGFHTIWKVTEHIIRWCSLDAGAHGTPVEVNRVGLCSESKNDERHNLVKDTPKAPIALLWIFLADAELHAGLGHTIYDKLMARKDGDLQIGTRALKASLVHRRSFFVRDFSNLPLIAEDMAIAAILAQKQSPTGFFEHRPNPEIPKDINNTIGSFAEHSFCSALLSLISEGKEWQINLATWRTNAQKSVSSYDFKSLFDRIESVMQLGQTEAGKVYQAATSQFDHVLSSIRLATSPDSSLSNCFVGCASLVTNEWFAKAYNGEGNILGIVVRNVWLKRLNFRAEFSLPRVSVPAVENACKLTHSGLKLAANILLAAELAVTTKVPQNTQATLQTLAAN